MSQHAGVLHRWRDRLSALLIVIVHVGLLGYNIWRQSPTVDEPAHLIAGISYWKTGQFDLYSVNPPLARLVSAWPVLGMNPHLEGLDFTARPPSRLEFGLGRKFIQQNGERAWSMLRAARMAGVVFSLLGALTCLIWSTQLAGRTAGLVALSLWCFFPEILAHAPLITADVPAAATGLLAGYLYWRWLIQPSWRSAWLAGIAGGGAILTKSTWLILFAVWPVMWWVVACWPRMLPDRRHLATLGQGLAILGSALLTVNMGYLFQGTGTRLEELGLYSEAFSGQKLAYVSADLANNRFRQSLLGKLPLPLPLPLVQGLDLQALDFEHYTPLYLAGRWYPQGCWYAYLYIALVKWPLGFLALLLLRATARPSVLTWKDSFALLMTAGCVGLFVSWGATPGYARYLLPVLPFLFVWCSTLFAPNMAHPRRALAWSALLWLTSSSISVFPHSLAYYNELAGGPRNGPAHLIDCNIDWGQDLFELKRWQDRHPEAKPLFVSYFGPINPKLCGLVCRTPSSPRDIGEGRFLWEPGYYALSIHLLRSGSAHYHDDPAQLAFPQFAELSSFLNEQPIAYVGHTIAVYKIEAATRSPESER